MRSIIILVLLLGGVSFAAEEAPARTADIDREFSDARMRIYTLTLEGSKMTVEQVREAEARVAENPTDTDTRYRLLGAYRGRKNTHVFAAKRAHLLWFIENRPEDPIFGTAYTDTELPLEQETYDAAVEAFEKQIEAHPENTRILGHAARFSMRKDRELVTDLLERARRIEPRNPEWPRRLAGVYQHRAFYIGKPELYDQAYREWFHVYELVDADDRLKILPQLASTALDAGLSEDAKTWAGKALDSVEKLAPSNRHGEAINIGHSVLGRLALEKGDVEAAKRHLLASAKTPGSPKLNSVGPNLKLAHLLVMDGHSETVIEYLQACRAFWKAGGPQIDEWIEILKSGDKPFFGDNLKI